MAISLRRKELRSSEGVTTTGFFRAFQLPAWLTRPVQPKGTKDKVNSPEGPPTRCQQIQHCLIVKILIVVKMSKLARLHLAHLLYTIFLVFFLEGLSNLMKKTLVGVLSSFAAFEAGQCGKRQ